MQLVFNELSLVDIPNEIENGKLFIEKFISAYNSAVKEKYGFSRSIQTCVDLNYIEIAKNYYAYQWRNSTDRDIARRFSGLCDRQIITDMLEDEVELSCCKGIGKGLLTAHLNNEFLFSLATHNYWENFMFSGNLYDLSDDSNSEVQVYNLTSGKQLDDNSLLIAEIALKQIYELNSGEKLLSEINNIYPFLIFHKNAQDQLKNEIESQHIPALCKKLSEINTYFSEWNGGAFEPQKFKTKISPESQATLEMFKTEHTFSFEHKDVLASFHLRYTGNIPGRIYFCPDNSTGKGLICSLATKLYTSTLR